MITIEKYTNVDNKDWQKVLKGAAFRPVQYESFWISYQEHYQRSHSEELVPMYYVFYSEEAPVRRAVAIWPVSVQKKDGKITCGFLNDDIFPPLTVKGLVPKITRQIYDRCWDILKGLKDNYGIEKFRFIQIIRFAVVSLENG